MSHMKNMLRVCEAGIGVLLLVLPHTSAWSEDALPLDDLPLEEVPAQATQPEPAPAEATVEPITDAGEPVEPVDPSPLHSEAEAPVPVEEPVAQAAESGPTHQSVNRRKSPFYYSVMPPSWSFQFGYSPKAFGSDFNVVDSTTGQPESYRISQMALQFEKLFDLAGFASLGIGPSIAFYPVSPSGGLTSGSFALMSGGASAVLGIRILEEQWIVPIVGYEFSYLRYKLLDVADGSGSTTISGPRVGVHFYLNPIDRDSAFEMYTNTGVSRSYLIGEVRFLSSGDARFATEGKSLFVGIRLEL